MSAIKDGGPAFPVPMFTRQSDGQPMSAGEFFEGGNGLSLRDWFAGMALNAIVSKSPFEQCDIDETHHEEMAARGAYGYADAMIAARERKEEK